MKDLPPITPAAVFSELLPGGTVFAPRTTLENIQWVFFNDAPRLDFLTGSTMAIMGSMPLICHKNTATELILDFFRQSGVDPASRIETYETEKEFITLAQKHINGGEKLVYVYPPPPQISHPDGLLVSVSLYNWLNDKANLAHLVEEEFLPPSRIIHPGSLIDIYDAFPGYTVFIKACVPGASGAGTDVIFCPDTKSRLKALEYFSSRIDGLTGIRVEEALEIGSCWCLNLAVLESSVRYLGAATQLFSEPAKQSGNRIDPEDLPPPKAIAIGLNIAEKARIMGYRGVAGFDIGINSQGDLFVFDLNFRLAGSTPLVLLHDAATRRTGARISQSWNKTIKGPLEPALKLLSGFSRSGQFVPTRLFDGSPETGGKSVVTGIITSSSVSQAEERAIAMGKVLGPMI